MPSDQPSRLRQLWQRPLARDICLVLIAKLTIIIVLKMTVFNDPLGDHLDGEGLAQHLFFNPKTSSTINADADL